MEERQLSAPLEEKLTSICSDFHHEPVTCLMEAWDRENLTCPVCRRKNSRVHPPEMANLTLKDIVVAYLLEKADREGSEWQGVGDTHSTIQEAAQAMKPQCSWMRTLPTQTCRSRGPCVRDGQESLSLPDNPERFDSTRESSARQASAGAPTPGRAVGVTNGSEYSTVTAKVGTPPTLARRPARVLIRPDCHARVLSFRDAEDMTPIHTFKQLAEGTLYSYFSPCVDTNGALRICPETVTVSTAPAQQTNSQQSTFKHFR